MATFQKFEAFVEAVANGKHNLGEDELAIMLTNTAPDPAEDAVLDDIEELDTGTDGYTAGGESIAVTSSTQTDGVYSLAVEGGVFWESTGTLGPFRYAVMYNKDAPDSDLIAFWDRGSSVTVDEGDFFGVFFDEDGGTVFTLT